MPDKTPETKTLDINFTYIIKNDGKGITKKFEWTWGTEDVLLTLLTVLIQDVKTNINPEGYESFLNFIWTQYATELMPEKLITADKDSKEEIKK